MLLIHLHTDNDMHFHYGYHIYAAAVVAHFDPEWGKSYFERVLLLIRNIANPSADDRYFPVMRHKDPYQVSLHEWLISLLLCLWNRNLKLASHFRIVVETGTLVGVGNSATPLPQWAEPRIF